LVEFNYKSLTKEELSKIFNGTLSFKLAPMWHQLVSLAFAADHDRVAFWHGVGTGKTLLSLWTTQLWESKKILVVCPSSAFNAWERDITKYTNFSYEFLTGSGRERKTKLRKNPDVAVINYEGLKTLYCNLKKGMGWKIQYNSFIHNFDCLILDEVHRCKAYNSLQSNICYILSKKAKHVIGLTGTAFDTDLLEPFNIYKVIDLGKALGPNFFTYRRRFFKPGLYNWTIKDKKMEEKILAMMAKSTISFDREECFELPEIQKVIREVEPSKEFLDLQHKIITTADVIVNGRSIYLGEAVEKKGGAREELQSRPALLRELCGGFIYYKENKADKLKDAYYLKKNAKLEALLDLLEDASGKAVIFYLHRAEGEMLRKAFTKAKIGFREIKGGQSRLEKKKGEKDFWEKDSIRCMLTQIGAGSEGWDGAIANLAVFYTLVASPKVRKQCIGRIHRKGQKQKCLVVDLLLKHSVDRGVIKNRGKRMDFVAIANQYMRDYGGVENI